MDIYEAQEIMKTDHVVHSGWGHHITVSDVQSNENEEDWIVDVWGHLPNVPKLGETLLAVNRDGITFTKFEFIEVRQETNPPDMFFAKVKAVEQWVDD